MTKLAFVNAKVYSPLYLPNAVVLVDDNKIEKVVFTNEYNEKIKPTNQYLEINLDGLNLSPGFIDLQVNGCGGANFNETLENLSFETLNTMHSCNVKHGVTTFLPTLITSPIEFRRKALEVITDFQQANPDLVASVPGIHIEGPHISIEKKGTHNPAYIKPMQQVDLDLYLEYKDIIKMLTLAPEENDLALVKQLLDAGILVSIGHTNATYEKAKEFINAGVKSATHLFNAMTSITNGRTPGVIGAIYESPEISPGLIVDGVHVNWPLVNLSLKVKKDRIFIVTDAVTPAGTDVTEFKFANKIIKVINQGCYDEFGCLSGSAITMDSQLSRLKENSDLSTEEILSLVTYNPAKHIGMEKQIGTLYPEAFANLAVFDDEFNIKATYVNGKEVYHQ
ncbi:N-acetylglucosamine-6-phosphate deacetylase [Psittacicella hinzii]|uniref:N-acetylglucosamine-6-phosphate deacetylase n=1 Tax=Psittacicella hinzii TaxID=2028575 RepID=A0A3A1YTT3_9GAMM|nr:N-acetylglucosamine-6-phosphate deacetylase [Psittacicella hinzii]RIY39834.1 N-acetylglucosamine-6-phosphate deacetylase [Psittacicella hinzii]